MRAGERKQRSSGQKVEGFSPRKHRVSSVRLRLSTKRAKGACAVGKPVGFDAHGMRDGQEEVAHARPRVHRTKTEPVMFTRVVELVSRQPTFAVQIQVGTVFEP